MYRTLKKFIYFSGTNKNEKSISAKCFALLGPVRHGADPF